MKNSTQITFAFQDPPEQGENPGVGVRIKSLKKGPNEKEAAGGTGENQPQLNNQPEQPADPRLFDEITDKIDEGQSQSGINDQKPAELKAEAQVQSEEQPQLQSESERLIQAGGHPDLQWEAKSQSQPEGQSEANLRTQPDTLSEAKPQIQPDALSEAKPQIQPDALSEAKLRTQPEGENQTQELAQLHPDTGNLPQFSIENRVQSNSLDKESANLDEYDNDLRNKQEQNEEDADLPVFRGSSLSPEFPVSAENENKHPDTDSFEVESRELDEQDNTNSGTEKASKSTRGRKSLKTIDEGTELINIPPDDVLFQKQYYAIGEVAEMFHVNQSLLRFWETEFDIIQPRKNRKGDRHFRPIDIKNLLLIHDLLRRRKLTIEGAKDFLKKNKRSPERFAMIQSLQKIKGFILEIKATL